MENFFTLIALVMVFIFFYCQSALASPYGFDTYGSNVPYGSQTMLTLTINQTNVAFIANVNQTTTNFDNLADNPPSYSNKNRVTVQTTDTGGYTLSINSLTSNTKLVNGSSTIDAASSAGYGALAVNTWGYHHSSTFLANEPTTFKGITAAAATLKNATSGPYYNTPDKTYIIFGVNINNLQPAGTYTTDVVLTANANSP